jgi:hypothetical protein
MDQATRKSNELGPEVWLFQIQIDSVMWVHAKIPNEARWELVR